MALVWAKMRFVLEDMDYVREAHDAALRAVSPYTRANPEALPHQQKADESIA